MKECGVVIVVIWHTNWDGESFTDSLQQIVQHFSNNIAIQIRKDQISVGGYK